MVIDATDTAALVVFLTVWIGYSWFTERGPFVEHGLSSAIDKQRERWMRVMFRRDLRMIDTAIMAGLQQGTAFFASACIFAIGGTFAMLGSAERIAIIASDLPLNGRLDMALVELKLLGLVMIFCYAFFKFGWAYRLFNYCSILIGGIPMWEDAQANPADAERSVARAARLNQQAALHFNSGLRAIFFALAYLGWFLGPYALFMTTFLVLMILANRQFRSPARQALTD